MRNESSPAISIRSAVSQSTRAISLFSKPPLLPSIVDRPFGRSARCVSMRYVLGLALFVIGSILNAQSTAFSVVNAASYGSAVAPDSLVTIFGTGLAQATATAVLDADGH